MKAELNYSDLLTVTDMVCSTAFDRDDEFFATAGVFRRVKIFDFASVQDSHTSIHYPVLEIPSRCDAVHAACAVPIAVLLFLKWLHFGAQYHGWSVASTFNCLQLYGVFRCMYFPAVSVALQSCQRNGISTSPCKLGRPTVTARKRFFCRESLLSRS